MDRLEVKTMRTTKRAEALKHTWNLRENVWYLEKMVRAHMSQMTDLEKGAVKEALFGAYNQMSRIAELYGDEDMVEVFEADMMAVSQM